VSDTIERVRELLRGRIAELDEEAGRLRQAMSRLDGGAPAAARRPHKRRAKGRRAARGERRRQFLAAVGTNPDATVSEIAKLIGVSANQAGSLARRLEASGEIVRSGRRVRLTAKASA
jgi:hypothetical protein